MLTHLLNTWYRLRSSLWLIPSFMCLGAFFLALFAEYLDSLYQHTNAPELIKSIVYQGDLDGARTLLSTVAGSMITVAGVSFSITMVALTLASSQFGPRLLMNFMRDKGNQIVLGTFVASFLYCLMALGNGNPTDKAPLAISATIGLVFAIIGVFVLIYFIHHVSSTIRAEHVVQSVAKDTLQTIRRLAIESCPEELEEKPDPENWQDADTFDVIAQRSGYLQALDESGLINNAARINGVIKLALRPGKFVIAGEKLAIVHTQKWGTEESKRYQKCFIIGNSRSDEQDPEYGISQLVEVAVRALSPGINDPHTAIACIDWLGSGLREIACKPIRGPYCFDNNKKLRVIREEVDFDGLINTAFDQTRQNSREVPAVAIRLLETLNAIYKATEDNSRQLSIKNQARLVMEGVRDCQWQSRDASDLEERFQHLMDENNGN